MKVAIRTLAELGEDLVLAPERWIAAADESNDGVPLGDLVVERREKPTGASNGQIVIDTTHARDGLLDIAAAVRASPEAKSAKKLACAGDLVVSRLRPYLRQIAYVHPRAFPSGKSLALSTEFYVLAPIQPNDDLAFLLPFLLGSKVQAILAAAQEGGHHPRVPRSTVLGLRVPKSVVASRKRVSKDVNQTLDTLYQATDRFQALLKQKQP